MIAASFLLSRAALALALCAAFAGQAQQPASVPQDDEARTVERIRAERAAAGAAYERRVTDCAGSFAVSSCVADARAERHAIDTRLDREQQAIDDARRRRRAAERERAIADKLEGEEAAKREAAALARSQARAAASERAVKPLPVPASAAAARPGKPQPDAAQRAEQEARARRSYELKQLQAEAHRLEVQRRNAEHARKANPGAPLPVPAASAASGAR
jgi:colicin import membrane protein